MNLVNEAALLAARRGKRVVTRQEFEDARDKIMMGAERRTLMMTEEEKRLTAYHEGGPRAGFAVDAGLARRSTRRRSFRAAARSAWCSRCPSATRSRRATSS